ncbi:MAG TPA: calcium/sodium antiporter [Spirochaetia bacterium]|nr:calcium/sodium antiporter [Spirochaetia bacterium]
MLNAVFLFTGFVPLIFGANLLVDSASALAKKLNIPNIVIGLTIVAFGTSMPELIVNLFSASTGHSDIALGNVIGSNIFNVLCILGVSAVIFPLAVKTTTTWIEIPFSFLAALVVLVAANDILLDHAGAQVIDRGEGILLLLFFVIFLGYNFNSIKTGSFTEEVTVKDYTIAKSIILLVLGIILLVISGRFIVFFAVRFALEIGLSERVIALTIVSIGTSLPELVTSAVSASKRNVDIAIGNIVGSNIFNIFLILGISAVIRPITVQPGAAFDLIVNMAAGLLLFLFIFTGKGRRLERWEGVIFLALFIAYETVVLLN